MNYGENTELILRKLEEEGPMTRSEICKATGLEHDYASAVISRLARPTKTIPKRVHVIGYCYDSEGKRMYPRAIYAIGDGRDAKKPKPDKKAIRKRYEERRKVRIVGFSVFTLGMTRDQVREVARQRVAETQHG